MKEQQQNIIRYLKRYKKWVSLTIIAFVSFGTVAQTESYTQEITLGTSNDFFVWFSNTDRFYTYGLHSNYRKINKGNTFFDKILNSEGISYAQIGFNIQAYTPDYLHPGADLKNRPYAGWSYLELKINALKKNSTFSLGLDLGVLGPHSYAGNIQNWFHRKFTGDPILDGWKNQIGDMIGVNVRFDYFKPVYTSNLFDISLKWENSLGNIFMYSEPNAVFRFGKFNPYHQSAATNNGLLFKNNTTEFFMEMGLAAKVSTYNATLQGNIFKDDDIFKQDEINNLILNGKIAAILAYKRYTASIRYYWSDGEFNNGDRHQYITILTSFKFN